ncbi:MAG: ABC transporter permease [Myxococcales bacterium]|nr:ABC transporter permease [Myxococcales bacterium]
MRVEALAVARKEVRQTLRDKRTLVVLVIAPLLQLTVLGFAVNLEVEGLPTVIVDADRTAASRDFAADLTAGELFEVVERSPVAADGVAALVAGEAEVALVLPRGFARAELAGRPAPVQVLTDGSNANHAIVARNAVEAFALQRGLQRLRERGAVPTMGRPDVRPRVLYNPTLDSRVYFVPGVAATLLLVVTFIVTAMGLAREKEAGTLEQVLVTPLPPSALVVGKTLPYAVVGMLDLGLVVTAGAAIFDVPLRGSLFLLAFAGALYLLTTLGLGLLVATLAKNQQQAFMAAFFIILPMVLLSGFMSPVPNMPEWLQYATLLDPVRHFVEILRGVLLKAAGWADLAPQLVALGGMGVLVFLLSARALSRKLA